jgi:hypothetical protein
MGLPTPLLAVPYGVSTLSPAVPSSLEGRGLPTPSSAMCPSLVSSGLASRMVADNSSTTRLEAATSIIAHHAASREELDMRRNSYDVDDFIARLRRVNGDVECDAAAAIGCCIVVYTHCLHIKVSHTPLLLFKEPPLPLAAEPSFTPGTDLDLPTTRFSRPPPQPPSSLAGCWCPRPLHLHLRRHPYRRGARGRSVLFGLVASHFWIPCTPWIPQTNCSTMALQYLRWEINWLLTPLAIILEGEGVRWPISHWSPYDDTSVILCNARRAAQQASAASINAEAGPSSATWIKMCACPRPMPTTPEREMSILTTN